MADTTHIDGSLPTSRAPELLAELHRLIGELQTVDLSACSDTELVDVAADTEKAIARLTYAGDRQMVTIADRDLPHRTGYRSITAFITHRLRVSDPMRRNNQREATATHLTHTGEALPPEHPTLAEALADGRVGTAHVRAVIDVLDQIPHGTDHDVKVAAERQMAEIAEAHTPADITQLGARLLAHLDPDGTLADDTDHKRRRNLWIGRQRADGTAKISGTLTPELVARLTMMFAVWGKPGLNNPDDPASPRGPAGTANPDALATAADRDQRTPAQTNHDALDAALTAGFADGTLGTSHRGLPVQLIIKADLGDLVREAGLATTATDTLLPIPDVIALAADAQPWLAVFKDATTVPLHFGRGKRLATREQRLVSFARPDGEVCSAPGCDQPATHVELHHAHKDWAKGGLTDIDDLAPACPRHNRMVGDQPGQYTTRIARSGPDEGRCVWRLNTEPGAPPNPEHINRRPDIPRRFTTHLNTVRDEIHGPTTRPGDQARPDQARPDAIGHGDRGRRLELAYRQLVHPPAPPEHLTTQPLTPVEAALTRILADHA